MGANDRTIYRGASYDQWWIYYDESCGEKNPGWVVSTTQPDFSRTTNLQNTQSCTYTMIIHQDSLFPFEHAETSFSCDDALTYWSLLAAGHEVIIDFNVGPQGMCLSIIKNMKYRMVEKIKRFLLLI